MANDAYTKALRKVMQSDDPPPVTTRTRADIEAEIAEIVAARSDVECRAALLDRRSGDLSQTACGARMNAPVEITPTRLQFATQAVAAVLSFGMIAVWVSLVARGMGHG